MCRRSQRDSIWVQAGGVICHFLAKVINTIDVFCISLLAFNDFFFLIRLEELGEMLSHLKEDIASVDRDNA